MWKFLFVLICEGREGSVPVVELFDILFVVRETVEVIAVGEIVVLCDSVNKRKITSVKNEKRI